MSAEKDSGWSSSYEGLNYPTGETETEDEHTWRPALTRHLSRTELRADSELTRSNMTEWLQSHHVDEHPTLLRWCKRMDVMKLAQRSFQYHQGRVQVVNNQRDASIDLGRLVLRLDISNATQSRMTSRKRDHANGATFGGRGSGWQFANELLEGCGHTRDR